MIPYFEEQVDCVHDALSSIDPQAFDDMVNAAVSTLSNGGRIIVTGLGKNVPICEKFAGTMASLGLDALFVNTDSAFHGDLGYVHNGDMLIALSKSGETTETLDLVEELLRQKRAVDIWAISFSNSSALFDIVPHTLVMSLPHEGDLWDIMPINSSTVNLMVLQGLAIAIAEKLGITRDEFASNHPGGAIGAKLRNEEIAR